MCLSCIFLKKHFVKYCFNIILVVINIIYIQLNFVFKRNTHAYQICVKSFYGSLLDLFYCSCEIILAFYLVPAVFILENVLIQNGQSNPTLCFNCAMFLVLSTSTLLSTVSSKAYQVNQHQQGAELAII